MRGGPPRVSGSAVQVWVQPRGGVAKGQVHAPQPRAGTGRQTRGREHRLPHTAQGAEARAGLQDMTPKSIGGHRGPLHDELSEKATLKPRPSRSSRCELSHQPPSLRHHSFHKPPLTHRPHRRGAGEGPRGRARGGWLQAGTRRRRGASVETRGTVRGGDVAPALGR